MSELFTEVSWFVALTVAGIGFLALLVIAFAVWVVADMFRWRRTDAAETARLSLVAKNTGEMTKP